MCKNNDAIQSSLMQHYQYQGGLIKGHTHTVHDMSKNLLWQVVMGVWDHH